MRRIIQVRVYRGEKYYIAACIDLPVVTQGKTLDKVVESIREAINLHLEEDLVELDIFQIFRF
jgi:predicted RNase H-like HicB family nuclease